MFNRHNDRKEIRAFMGEIPFFFRWIFKSSFNRIMSVPTSSLYNLLPEEGDVILEMLPVHVDQEAIVSGETFNTSRGEGTYLQALLKERGYYQLQLTCRAASGNSELAQIPVSIFRDSDILKTITLTGGIRNGN